MSILYPEGDYMVTIRELVGCLSCDKLAECDYRRKQKELLERHYIEAADQLARSLDIRQIEFDEAKAKKFVDAYLDIEFARQFILFVTKSCESR